MMERMLEAAVWLAAFLGSLAVAVLLAMPVFEGFGGVPLLLGVCWLVVYAGAAVFMLLLTCCFFARFLSVFIKD